MNVLTFAELCNYGINIFIMLISSCEGNEMSYWVTFQRKTQRSLISNNKWNRHLWFRWLQLWISSADVFCWCQFRLQTLSSFFHTTKGYIGKLMTCRICIFVLNCTIASNKSFHFKRKGGLHLPLKKWWVLPRKFGGLAHLISEFFNEDLLKVYNCECDDTRL